MEGETNLRRTATLGALASVAIVIGIIVVVWLLFFRDNGSSSNNQANGNNNQSQQAENQPANENPAQSGSGNATGDDRNGSTATPAPAPCTNNGTTGKNNGSGKNMPNTGPRENAVVFMGTALAATGVYYVYTRRKLVRG